MFDLVVVLCRSLVLSLSSRCVDSVMSKNRLVSLGIRRVLLSMKVRVLGRTLLKFLCPTVRLVNSRRRPIIMRLVLRVLWCVPIMK